MRPLTLISTLLLAAGMTAAAAAADTAWSGWRGPQQNGTSLETDLPERWTLDGENQLWTYDMAGRGTPAVASGRVYVMGYAGEGADLQELLVCLDERTGRRIWRHGFSDFLSDAIYSRYSIGTPTVDPETGQVYCLTTPGLLSCFSPDGAMLWQRSMMEEFGRLTFPNGRTGAPVVDEHLVITRGITSSWGPQGPARDRFFGFDKRTGELVWTSTPGTGPKDSCFSHPVLGWQGDTRVLYAGTGCGAVVCINARSGAPIWRFPMSIGGVNSAVLLAEDRLVAIHGRENLGTSSIGRMVAIRLGATPAAGEAGPAVLGTDHELWRNDLSAFSSAPVLVGNRVYLTDHTGELCCVDVETGEVLWHEKLGPDQIHAGPVFGDGKLYVPMTNGSFFIIEPSDAGPKILGRVQLAGNCLGPPAIAAGRVFVQTTERLYCFGRSDGVTPAPVPAPRSATAVGAGKAVRCVPSELLLRPGETAELAIRKVSDNGVAFGDPLTDVEWAAPPALDVRADARRLVAAAGARPGAAALPLVADDRRVSTRVRIVPRAPFTQDFEDIELAKTHPTDGVSFAFPPAHWIGGRLKWEVREFDGDRVLAKTLDRALFQRAMTFIGHPEMRDYTAQVDIRSDGNRRSMSTAGVINQRYMITLKGNHQQLEISSNQERIKHHVPFRWKSGVWYRLKTRVDTRRDGAAVVRAKAWRRDETEPEAWTIEFEHTHGHANGAFGLYGFTPQSRFRVYIDNIMVTPND